MGETDETYYQLHVFCCTNVRPINHSRGSCARKNAVQLREYMKQKAKAMCLGRIRINASGCLDRCELGPTMVIYPGGIWYRYKTEEDVDEILDQHVAKGKVVERLKLNLGDGPK